MDSPDQTSLFDFDKPDIQELPSDDELKQIIKARWLSCVCDKYARPQDWMKASEYLGKSLGLFVEKQEVKHSGAITKTLDDFYNDNGDT
jgi:hypothetical protein